MLYPLSYEGWSAGFSERLAGEEPNRQPRRPLAAEVMLATRSGHDYVASVRSRHVSA